MSGERDFKSLVVTPLVVGTSCRVFRQKSTLKNVLFAFKFSESPDDILWAKFNPAKGTYLISGNVDDFTKPKLKRSNAFVGKLKCISASRVYIGYFQNNIPGHAKEQLVSIVYDHERNSLTDRKMDVGICLSSPDPAHITYSAAAVSSSQTQREPHELFMQILKEGAQNHVLTDRVYCLVQESDAEVYMSSDKSVVDIAQSWNDRLCAVKEGTNSSTDVSATVDQPLSIGGFTFPTTSSTILKPIILPSVGPIAGINEVTGESFTISTKNFTLAKSKPSRAEALGISTAFSEEEVSLQFAKNSTNSLSSPDEEDTFSCYAYAPLSFLTSFMVVLSRFDTTQTF